jgi:putative ABC transport system permease protein
MNIWQDFRFGARMFVRRPGFTLAAVLTLTLGIGAMLSIFSIFKAVLLRPLPYRAADRLTLLWERNVERGEDHNIVSPFNFLRWKERSQSFAGMAAVNRGAATLTGSGSPEWLQAGSVSYDFFHLLGVEPVKGRSFLPEEEKTGRVVVLGASLWQHHFGSDPGIVGRVITLDDEPYTIVGVMPPGFEFLQPVDLWKPMALDPAEPPRGRSLTVVARLRPGVTLRRAQAEMETIARGLERSYPDFNTGWRVNVLPLREELVGSSRPMLLLLLAAVVFVLLVACANVANLFLSRSLERRREISVRVALGADRARLVRQLLSESVWIALAAAVLGLTLSRLGTGVLVHFAPSRLPRLDGAGIDHWTLALAAGLILLLTPLFGLAPALSLSRTDLGQGLKEGGRTTAGKGRIRVREALVVTDVVMAIVLLVGAGLLLRSLIHLQQVDLGFEPDRLLTMRISLPKKRYPEPRQWISFFEQVNQRIEALPGAHSASAVSFLPMAGFGAGQGFTVEGRPAPPPGQEPVADLRFITPGYFKTMGIPLLRGREIAPSDTRDQPFVICVGKGTAERLWPDENAIGKRIHMKWAEMVDGKPHPIAITATVVGVVGDIREQGFESEPGTMLYWPFRQLPWNPMYVVVRTSVDAEGVVAGVRRAVESVDPEQPIYAVQTMESRLADSIGDRRFSMTLLSIFALLALVLAAIGLYGILSQMVGQRRQEIGVRMALGGTRGSVLRLTLGQGLRLVLLGVALGLPLSFAFAKLLASLLYKVSSADPLVLVAICSLLLGVAMLACYIPASRAAKLEPTIALRGE